MTVGELVRLRPMGLPDAEALWRWNHDPDVMRWMEDGYAQPLSQVEKRLAERPRNTYGDVLLGIEVLAGEKLVGLVRLHGAEPETGCSEIDIYIGEKEYWGRGIATDAMRTACRYGFEKMRLHRITLTVVTENHAARRVYEKVGFVEEGRLRQVFRRDGRWHDMFVMGLLEGELRGAPEPGGT
ncbi:GNAT family N-acetyltransferase [Streptomyces sp. SCUT-3]|uniref:GNAT family N-acetyltransferase n=1 Tax=Streptomyces TaxID=1883 RepID=UPI000CAA9A17|nr:GNAT family protein [Streptomyces sp. SCUT-3]PLW74540.1 RimJ/RimL family protein N-acetyltransferase [Streptomyces sp. DJ]QMV24700.1 GNAT family N-acetyltransferase [Streptomyces sp. SCUT-3]